MTGPQELAGVRHVMAAAPVAPEHDASLAWHAAWAEMAHAEYLRGLADGEARAQQAAPQRVGSVAPAEHLHLGACLTEGKLHATVMRRESDGCISVVATAEIDELSLRAHDCLAVMRPTPSEQPARLAALPEPPAFPVLSSMAEQVRHAIDLHRAGASLAQAIGVLEIVKQQLIDEQKESL